MQKYEIIEELRMRSGIVPRLESALPSGFDGFDVDDEEQEETSGSKLRDKLRESPSVIDASQVVNRKVVDRVEYFDKHKVWFIDSKQSSASKAKSFGLKVQKALKSESKLKSHVPDLRKWELYVGWGGDKLVKLPSYLVKKMVRKGGNYEDQWVPRG